MPTRKRKDDDEDDNVGQGINVTDPQETKKKKRKIAPKKKTTTKEEKKTPSSSRFVFFVQELRTGETALCYAKNAEAARKIFVEKYPDAQKSEAINLNCEAHKAPLRTAGLFFRAEELPWNDDDDDDKKEDESSSFFWAGSHRLPRLCTPNQQGFLCIASTQKGAQELFQQACKRLLLSEDDDENSSSKEEEEVVERLTQVSAKAPLKAL